MKGNNVQNDPFWASDLSEIEANFLTENEQITDLPTHFSSVVPPQGSVLLNRTYMLKKEQGDIS